MPCLCCNDRRPSDFEPFIKADTLIQRCPLDNGARKFALPTVASMDRLQTLPLEVYHACLKHLDIGSITTLRRLSQYSRSVVDLLPQYKDLYNFARPALRACLATSVAYHIPLLRLHGSLTSLECYYCKYHPQTNGTESRFGSYLTLPGGRRTCLYCLRNLHSLRLVELSSLISLRYQPGCSLPPIKDLTLLHTIPGSYTCEIPSARPGSFSRSTLTPGYSMKPMPGRVFTEKETRIVCGFLNSTQIVHHPFVLKSQESNISPAGYYPETDREIIQRYSSAIAFPYLSSSKSTTEHGLFCTECCWKMAWEEHRWQQSQRRQTIAGQNPTASTNRRNVMNALRKIACRQYIVSETAIEDAKRTGVESITLEEHLLGHQDKDKIGENERLWRITQKEKGPIFGVPKHMFG